MDSTTVLSKVRLVKDYVSSLFAALAVLGATVPSNDTVNIVSGIVLGAISLVFSLIGGGNHATPTEVADDPSYR
jgi:hypothetical protein